MPGKSHRAVLFRVYNITESRTGTPFLSFSERQQILHLFPHDRRRHKESCLFTDLSQAGRSKLNYLGPFPSSEGVLGNHTLVELPGRGGHFALKEFSSKFHLTLCTVWAVLSGCNLKGSLESQPSTCI